ncbi:MAG: DUF2079 domain-containing protein [Candidatus Saganbacteria bacterium]|nr:DUF2079 domain-containing protein [Candidatus Saganbacteria bacterium]
MKLLRSALDWFNGLGWDRLFFCLVVLAALVYVVVFSAYSIILHENFMTQAFDAGIDDQGIWLLSRFLPPFVTVRGLNLFGDSVTLTHFFFAPLLWLWNSFNMLLIAQTFWLAIGAIPLFFFARERFKNGFLAMSVSFSYLLYPALQNMNLDQFHSEVIAVLFLIMTIYYLLKERYMPYYVFLVLSLVAKDEVALTGLFLGLFLILFKGKFKHGVITILLSASWYLLCSRVFMPVFNDVGILAPQPLTYSHWFRGLTSNLYNVDFYLHNLFCAESMFYYLGLLLPVAFLPLFSPPVLFLLIPSVGVNVLSGTGYLRSVSYHYNYIQTAVIFFALIGGAAFWQRVLSRWRMLERLAPTLLGLLIFSCAIVSNLSWSRLPLNRQWELFNRDLYYLYAQDNLAKHQAVSLVPENAGVAASYSLVPHLSHRQYVYMFPNPFKQSIWGQWFQEGKGLHPAFEHVDYIVLETGLHSSEERLVMNYLRHSLFYDQVLHKDPVLVIKKVKKVRPADQGAKFFVQRINDKSGFRARGIVSVLYFPDSRYDLRSLLGEIVTAEKSVMVSFAGYLDLPESGKYDFKLVGRGQKSMSIDGRTIKGPLWLRKGVHEYKISYINTGNDFMFKLTVVPPGGNEQIVPDSWLRLNRGSR